MSDEAQEKKPRKYRKWRKVGDETDVPSRAIYFKVKSKDVMSWLYRLRGTTGQALSDIIESALERAMADADFKVEAKIPWYARPLLEKEKRQARDLELAEKVAASRARRSK